MRCGKARKLMLRGTESAELAEHLAHCALCRAERDALARIDDLLDTWREGEPKLGYDALLTRLSKRPAGARRTPLVGVTPRWATVGLVAASIGLGVVAGVCVEQPKPRPVPSEQEVAVAMDMSAFGDVVESSVTYGIEKGTLTPGGVQ